MTYIQLISNVTGLVVGVKYKITKEDAEYIYVGDIRIHKTKDKYTIGEIY